MNNITTSTDVIGANFSFNLYDPKSGKRIGKIRGGPAVYEELMKVLGKNASLDDLSSTKREGEGNHIEEFGVILGPHYAFDTKWGKKNCALAHIEMKRPETIKTITGSEALSTFVVIQYTDEEYKKVIEWAKEYRNDQNAARPEPYVLADIYELSDPITGEYAGTVKYGPRAFVVYTGNPDDADKLYDTAPHVKLTDFIKIISRYYKTPKYED